MKASPRQQRLLLELQDLDTALSRIERRLTTLPERAQIAAMAAEHREAKDAFMALQRELDAQSADLARFANDTQTVRERKVRDEELLAVSTSAKEAQALQSEMETLTRRQSELEDRELALMESNEHTRAQYDAAVQALAGVDARRADLTEKMTTASEALITERASLTRDREGLSAEIQRDLVELYESLRARIGIGAARLRGNVSEASNMSLAPAEMSDIRSAAEDEIVFCPGTGAILVRMEEPSSE